MAETRLVYLIRHGQTEWNLEGRLQGSKDSPLTERGRKQAEAVASSLKNEPPAFLYASPLGRARTTAELIGKSLGISMETDERLCENRFGQAEGLTLDEVDRQWPGFQKHRALDKWNVSWPGGESYLDVSKRLKAFVSEKLAPALGELELGPLGVVGHQSMNMVLLGQLLELDPSLVLELGQPNHVVYRLSGSVIEHAYLGDNHLDWQPGIIRKRSDEIVLLDVA